LYFSGQKKIQIFTFEKDELLTYLKLTEGRLFSLTTMDYRNPALQLAQKNGNHHTSDKEVGGAVTDRLRGFMKRHPDLCLKENGAIFISLHDGFQQFCQNQVLLTSR
jgi:hypothetical protein